EGGADRKDGARCYNSSSSYWAFQKTPCRRSKNWRLCPMNNDSRKETLAALVRLSDVAPELRIGQLVAHLGEMREDEGGHGLGDIEDDRLLEVIRRHHEELLRAVKTSPNQSLQQSGAA